MDERLETILAKYEQEVSSLRKRVEELEKKVEALTSGVEIAPAESIELVHEDFLPDITEAPALEGQEPAIESSKTSEPSEIAGVPEEGQEPVATSDVDNMVETEVLDNTAGDVVTDDSDASGKKIETVETADADKSDKTVEVVDIAENEPVSSVEDDVTLEVHDSLDDLPEGDEEFSLFGGVLEEPAVKTEKPKPVRTLNDANAANVHKSISDAAAGKQAWRKDIPGPEVKDVRSAISLNDRVMFISTLFREDSMLFQDVVNRINSLNNLDKIVSYLVETFPEWNMESDLVYRFMMAVRRKVR